MSTKVNELTPKVDRYTVTDPDGQLSATEYNAILDAVQRHENQLDDNDFLRFSEQTLDDNDKRQARQNIGVVGEGDYAPKMSVGFADNLIGRGEATAEEFTYRASAGMERSITDDTARVKKIKGNSVVWNQVARFRGSVTTNGLTITNENNILRVSGTVTEALLYDILMLTDDLPKGLKRDGRKYLISLNAPEGVTYGVNGYPLENTKPHFWSATADTIWDGHIAMTIPIGTTVDYVFSDPRIIDLTQMFGAGNEPTTVEEFYTRIPSGIDVNAYNEGEIIDMNVDAIKTVGFNQWDEQWELGTITDHGVTAHKSAIVSRNFNKIIPSTKYYCAYGSDVGSIGNILQIGFWDMNMVYIGRQYATNKAIETPANAAYFKVATNTSANITTYNNDICINLSHTGTENGKYKPYTPFTRELPIIKKYFPNGMRSAGTAFDSIEWDSSKQKWVAVQRIGNVDIGELGGHYVDAYDVPYFQFFVANKRLATKIGDVSNTLCSSYTTTPITYASSPNKPQYAIMESMSESKNLVYVTNPNCTNEQEYKQALQGVILYYELAEPIVTEIEEDNINFDYYVEDLGTEEALSSVPSAPFRADVVYTFNAVDTIRNNYLAIEEMKKQMAQMQNTISAMQVAQVKVEE